jgi:cell shape-determining protein MreC
LQQIENELSGILTTVKQPEGTRINIENLDSISSHMSNQNLEHNDLLFNQARDLILQLKDENKKLRDDLKLKEADVFRGHMVAQKSDLLLQ